jgi:hypothetical protein
MRKHEVDWCDAPRNRCCIAPPNACAGRTTAANRTRQRQRNGLRSIGFDIRVSEVEALNLRGLLAWDDRGDPDAIDVALGKLLDVVLRPPRPLAPTPGNIRRSAAAPK